MSGNQPNLTASDIRPFVPAQDFELSLRFYTSLGWTLQWKGEDNKLAILELGNNRFFLQDYYVKELAENFMLQVIVEDATAWHEHVTRVVETEKFDTVRIRRPKKEDYGALVTHVAGSVRCTAAFRRVFDRVNVVIAAYNGYN